MSYVYEDVHHLFSCSITLKQCHTNSDATSRHCIDMDCILHKCHVLAGISPAFESSYISLRTGCVFLA